MGKSFSKYSMDEATRQVVPWTADGAQCHQCLPWLHLSMHDVSASISIMQDKTKRSCGGCLLCRVLGSTKGLLAVFMEPVLCFLVEQYRHLEPGR